MTASSRTYSDHMLARNAMVSELIHMDREQQRMLTTIEDLIGKLILWPAHLRTMFLSSHLRYSERFQLTLFLLGNWLPPLLIAEWYMKRNMLKDRSARDNVAGLIKQHMRGELEQKGYVVWTLAAPKTKPRALREHKYDGVGDDVSDKLQARWL